MCIVVWLFDMDIMQHLSSPWPEERLRPKVAAIICLPSTDAAQQSFHYVFSSLIPVNKAREAFVRNPGVGHLFSRDKRRRKELIYGTTNGNGGSNECDVLSQQIINACLFSPTPGYSNQL